MLLVLKGIEDFMIPCLNKKLLGFECLGCGLQRSVILILKGEFIEAFIMYPAVYTIIAFFGFLIFAQFKTIKNSNKIISILALLNVATIIISYLIKLYLN